MKFTLPGRKPFHFLSVVKSHGWYKGKPVTTKDVEKRFEKWGEFKGIAFWFWDWTYNGG